MQAYVALHFLTLPHSVPGLSLPDFNCFERVFLIKVSLPLQFPQCQVQLNSLL